MAHASLKTYLKLCTEYYELAHALSENERTFYLKEAADAQGPILEPMCGTGRFLIPLLDAGYDIEGFDASDYMLSVLKEKAPQAKISHCFIQDFSSPKKYGLIFVPYGSWGLITNPSESLKGLEIMHHHLLPGGKLILEIETVDSVPQPCGVVRRSTMTRKNGSKIALSCVTSYDPETQIFRSQTRYDSLENGAIAATEYEDFQQYLYRFEEMDEMLKAAGFTNIKKHVNYAKASPTKPTEPLLIYECIK